MRPAVWQLTIALASIPGGTKALATDIAPWHGSLQLTYAARNGRTQLARTYARAPLKVQRPFYPEGDAVCHSVTLHTAGGMAGGDRLSQAIHLQPGSHALVTTATAGKIYRSNGPQARQTVDVRLEAGACLEWLPQATIAFEGACYRQDVRVELEPDAHWVGWDITRFGRSARGERFCSGEWRSRLEVWRHGQPLWVDRQWMPGSEAAWRSPHGLGGCPVVGSLVWLGAPVPAEVVADAQALPPPSGSEAGVTLTPARGILCRYRGCSTGKAHRWLSAVWALLRRRQLHRPAVFPRVWPH